MVCRREGDHGDPSQMYDHDERHRRVSPLAGSNKGTSQSAGQAREGAKNGGRE